MIVYDNSIFILYMTHLQENLPVRHEQMRAPDGILACGDPLVRAYLNGVVPKAKESVVFPFMIISRGIVEFESGSYGPARYGVPTVAPHNGPPADGQIRATKYRHLVETFGHPPVTMTTSGDTTLPNGDIVSYSHTMSHAITNGAHEIIDVEGNTRLLWPLNRSKDTFGEVLGFPYAAYSVAQVHEGYPSNADGKKQLTVLSGYDQLDRIKTLEVLMFHQNTDTRLGKSYANRQARELQETLLQSPAIDYIRRNESAIRDLAEEGHLSKVQLAKALHVANSFIVEELTTSENLKHASDMLFNNPKYAETIRRCAPDLPGFLQWMAEEQIEITHLTVEEVEMALAKMDKGDLSWTTSIYGNDPKPDTNPAFITFVNELAGVLDYLKGYYYAQGDLLAEKKLFEQELSQRYGLD